MSQRTAKPCFEIRRVVEFHETDMAGIVHFSNFFRYMEAAEHAFLRSLDQHLHGVIDGLETGWPRVNASCDYRSPARFGDTLAVRVYIDEVRNRAVRYGFECCVGDRLVASGSITAAHVAITPEGIRARPIPESVRQKLLALMTSQP
jgi:YbgC/YbaW family acyl-CoA thioester hydrolase